MAGNSESSSFSEDSDVLMIDPFLDYINEILMEEGMDDATCMHLLDDVSYQAIFSGFHDILGEHFPLSSCFDSTSDRDVFDPHQRMYSYHEKGPNEQHVKVANPNDGFYSITNEPRIPLPANGHLQSSFQQERAKVGFTLKPDSGFQGHVMNTCMRGLEQGCSNLNLPSAHEDYSSKLAEVDLSFKDLKLKDLYTDLYVGEPSSLRSSTRGARDIKHNGDKKKPLAEASNRSKSGKKSTSEVQVFVDVKEVLVSCAQAMSIGDVTRANGILQELRQVHRASANGSCLQRTAHFFSEALAARLRGMGEQHLRAISRNMPLTAAILRDSNVVFGVVPFMKVVHYFANQSILKAAEGASRLHVVDYGFLYGMQWPCLIHALADRKEGPPLLVITGIEFPQPGINLEESGQRLAAYAKTYGVPFLYHAVVSNKWEDLDPNSLHLHEGEILVLNCLKPFHHLAEESADLALTTSPRQKLLTCMHNLNPHLLVTAVVSATYNSPFFVSRFRDALYHYSNIFDMLDTVCGDTSRRLMVESCLYCNIVNIVACEGAERVERPETYKQWHARIAKAGFEQLPIPATILSRVRSHMKRHHHKDFLIPDDTNGWMLMGWKGCILRAISAWKPRLV